MSKHLTLTAATMVMLCTCFCCKPKTCSSDFRQGAIEYSITYDDSLSIKYNTNLLPKRMVIKFDQKHTLNRIEGFSGAIALSHIADSKKKSNTVLVKIFNKKLIYTEPQDKNSQNILFEQMPKLQITTLPDTIRYLGYPCHRAIAQFNAPQGAQFEIIYTRSITRNNPNINTPFADIDGVMLRFKVKMGRYLMSLDAESVTCDAVSEKEFEIPEGYTPVDKETIENVLELLR